MDGLRFAVLEDFEILTAQIFNGISAIVSNDCADQDDVDGNFEIERANRFLSF
ncbi:MAG: hypothetical protein U0V70_21600 [Terriglobia bacterium]